MVVIDVNFVWILFNELGNSLIREYKFFLKVSKEVVYYLF